MSNARLLYAMPRTGLLAAGASTEINITDALDSLCFDQMPGLHVGVVATAPGASAVTVVPMVPATLFASVLSGLYSSAFVLPVGFRKGATYVVTIKNPAAQPLRYSVTPALRGTDDAGYLTRWHAQKVALGQDASTFTDCPVEVWLSGYGADVEEMEVTTTTTMGTLTHQLGDIIRRGVYSVHKMAGYDVEGGPCSGPIFGAEIHTALSIGETVIVRTAGGGNEVWMIERGVSVEAR